MRIINIGTIIGYFLLMGCSIAPDASKIEPKIAKTIPAVYLHESDLRLHIIQDTVFLDKSYYTGFIVGYHPSGDTAFTRGYFNGVLEGAQLTWGDQHILVGSEFYINGKKEGLQRTWWLDGKTQLRYCAIDDLYEGAFLEWNRKGILIKKFNYSKGQEVGQQRLWWDNGTVRANYEIRNGRKYGLIGLKLCANPND